MMRAIVLLCVTAVVALRPEHALEEGTENHLHEIKKTDELQTSREGSLAGEVKAISVETRLGMYDGLLNPAREGGREREEKKTKKKKKKRSRGRQSE